MKKITHKELYLPFGHEIELKDDGITLESTGDVYFTTDESELTYTPQELDKMKIKDIIAFAK